MSCFKQQFSIFWRWGGGEGVDLKGISQSGKQINTNLNYIPANG